MTTTNFIQVTGPLGCIRCDYSTKKHHDAGVNYDEQQRIFSEHLNAEHPGWMMEKPEQTTRSRLEKAVVEAAKAYGRAARAVEDHMKKSDEADTDPAAGWQLLRDMESTQEALMLEAVWPLLDFESSLNIKK